MAWLDLAELDEVFRGRWFWSTKRPALAWFCRSDYLGDASLPLDEAVRQRVSAEGLPRPAGPIRMLGHLRNFGHCFSPVTFYYCYDATDTRVEVMVAEITNTPWRERHSYVLPVAADAQPQASLHFEFQKAFHVSPFMPMDQHYSWRFTAPGQRIGIHMENFQSAGAKIFDATLTVARREISSASLAMVLLRFPFSTLRVLLAIYWQAARLRMKRIVHHPHPVAAQ
jgi:DUF1365 family protein